MQLQHSANEIAEFSKKARFSVIGKYFPISLFSPSTVHMFQRMTLVPLSHLHSISTILNSHPKITHPPTIPTPNTPTSTTPPHMPHLLGHHSHHLPHLPYPPVPTITTPAPFTISHSINRDSLHHCTHQLQHPYQTQPPFLIHPTPIY